MSTFIRHNRPHPGEILQALYIKPLHLTVKAASAQLLISKARLTDILTGKTRISASIALKLSKAFRTSPQLWLNLQANYDLWKAKQMEK